MNTQEIINLTGFQLRLLSREQIINQAQVLKNWFYSNELHKVAEGYDMNNHKSLEFFCEMVSHGFEDLQEKIENDSNRTLSQVSEYIRIHQAINSILRIRGNTSWK